MLFLLLLLFSPSSKAFEWDFRYQYILKEAYKDIPKGEHVALSRRYILRDKVQGIGILKCKGKYSDDPGVHDGFIPSQELEGLLEKTKDLAPNSHWVSHKLKGQGGDVAPNLKLDSFYCNSFPVHVYPLTQKNEKRPLQVFLGAVFRILPPQESCLKDEVTVGLRQNPEDAKYFREKKLEHSHLNVAEPTGSFCMPVDEFVGQAYQCSGGIPERIPGWDWDKFKEAYYDRFSGESVVKDSFTVKPFTEKEIKEGRSGPGIKVVSVKSLKAEEQKGLPLEGWIVSYTGPLYYSCEGSVCRSQGYKALLGSDGTVEKLIKNNLYYWDGSNELLLTANDQKRLLEISNDKKMLEKIHTWAQGKAETAFAAGMSRLSELEHPRVAGNSFGTFVIHMSKVRKELKLKEKWPEYEGPSPRSLK